MLFILYTLIIPVCIILICFGLQKRQINRVKILKALTVAIIPLFSYLLLTYYFEMEGYIQVGCVTYTIFFFFVPYVIIIGLINILCKKIRINTKLGDD